MKNNGQKSKTKKTSAEKQALGKALRSTGVLLPETEDEIEVFNSLYGSTAVELPEKLKTVDFLFEKQTSKKEAKVIPLPFLEDEYVSQVAYAAREGNLDLPEELLNKMSSLKKAKRAIKKSAAKKKK